jgi:hypothetical protein
MALKRWTVAFKPSASIPARAASSFKLSATNNHAGAGSSAGAPAME